MVVSVSDFFGEILSFFQKKDLWNILENCEFWGVNYSIFP
jgi:hypothetical protein